MDKKFLFLISILLSPSFSSASDGPSYEETVDYIVSKGTNREDRYSNGGSERVLFPKKCILRTVGKSSGSSSGIKATRTREVKVSDLDPSSLGDRVFDKKLFIATHDEQNLVSDKLVHIGIEAYKARNDSNSWVCTKSDLTCIERDYIESISIYTYNNKYITKLNNAFRHLIKLCGGKESLF